MMGSRNNVYEHKQTNPDGVAEILEPCATIFSIMGLKQNQTKVKISVYNASYFVDLLCDSSDLCYAC